MHIFFWLSFLLSYCHGYTVPVDSLTRLRVQSHFSTAAEHNQLLSTVLAWQVACQLLQHSQGRTEQADQVMRALAAASQAALSVHAATTAAVAEALTAAESGVSGMRVV